MQGPSPDQRAHWDATYAEEPELYGWEPSETARRAAARFHAAGVRRVLELGTGHGRDALFLAREGFQVTAVDASAVGLRVLSERARKEGLEGRCAVVQADLREPLPWPAASFDACVSHMLLNMAFTRAELLALSGEIGRVLRPGGLHVYSARSVHDPLFRQGRHHGENLYEMEGFIVHFLDHDLVRGLAADRVLLQVEEFEEGPLPRRLFLVSERIPG
ncbi:MAG TPA: class I SAM-dependent methyltransferase [Candidatus Thermoplasmatota archaeon]|nr:class I SAM-dependent methyltransferase [Candidatus Thermoplasmatota archaeon]